MNSRRRNAIPFTARPATISETPHYTTISPSSPPTRRTTLSYLTPLYDYVEPEPYQQRDVSTRRSSASSHASDLPRTPSSGQYSPITTRQRSSGSDLGFSLSEAEVNPVIAFRQLLEVHRARVHKSERQPLGTPSLSARSASVNTSLAGRRPFTRVHRVLPSSMTDVTSTFEVGANRNTVGPLPRSSRRSSNEEPHLSGRTRRTSGERSGSLAQATERLMREILCRDSWGRLGLFRGRGLGR